MAREWYAKYSATWAKDHGNRIIRRFERDIFPWIGGRPIAEIAAPELLAVVRRIEDRGALETAHRALGNCGQVFRYAVATGRAERDPSGDLRGALPPVKGEHFAATTDPKRVGEILRALDGYQGTLTVRCALRLAPLVFVRPGELRKAEWADIDLDAEEWRYTVTKTNTPHIVPLSHQAVAILRELQPLTGRGQFVFPGARSNGRPMSDNAILAAMRRMSIGKEEMSGHSFHAVARTILDEVLGVRRAATWQAGRMPGLPVLPRKRKRRGPKPTGATEPVAQHPAAFGFGTAQPARSRKPLAPSFWGGAICRSLRRQSGGPESWPGAAFAA